MTSESLKRVNAEIAREKAAALGRAGERLEAALEEVRTFTLLPGGAVEAGERARLTHEYERVRDARLALIIQREAVGLRQHRIVDQLFPEPPPRALT